MNDSFSLLKFLKILFGYIIIVVKAGQGFLNKDPIVWLDGARPANTCIPPSSQGMRLHSCV
jgi:hypothetical protein